MSGALGSAWPKTRVKRITAKIGSGKTPTGGSETYEVAGVLFLRSQNIHSDGIHLDDVVYISDETDREMASTRVCVGDSLLNITGASLGRITRVTSDLPQANVNQHVCIVRPRRSFDARYLTWSLAGHHIQQQILALQVGGNRDGLNFEQVGNLDILFPPLDEQRRIADFLDAQTARIDGLATARQRMRDLLVVKRERVVEQILGLDSSPLMLPLKYAVQSVGVGIVITPANWYVDDGGIPALRGLNIHPGRIDSSDLVQISHDGHRDNNKSRLSAGDVVVVRTGQAGAAAIVPVELDGSNCIDLLIIRPGNLTSSSFLAHYLNSFYVRDKISKNSVGSIQAHFNVSSMKKLDFPFMDLSEQERRAAALEEIAGDLDQLDSQLETQLALLSERRLALITAAVTGQIDVTTARGLSTSGGAAL